LLQNNHVLIIFYCISNLDQNFFLEDFDSKFNSLKLSIKNMIAKISEILNSISTLWSLLLSNGRIVACSDALSLENNTLVNIVKILRTIVNDIDIGTIYIVKELIIFRVSFNLFVFVKGTISKNVLRVKFKKIHSIYKNYQQEGIIEASEIEKKSVDIKLILFSMALDVGPHPIFYYPPNFNSELAFKISMKSMLLLQIETEGAKKDMISFQPFVNLDALGIVLTFQIEDSKARGGAYDSALTILIDYKSRALIYEKYSQVEIMINHAKEYLLKEYYIGNENYGYVLTNLKKNLSKITFEALKGEDLKDEMIEQIKKLINV
jgi:hypothetical protein